MTELKADGLKITITTEDNMLIQDVGGDCFLRFNGIHIIEYVHESRTFYSPNRGSVRVTHLPKMETVQIAPTMDFTDAKVHVLSPPHEPRRSILPPPRTPQDDIQEPAWIGGVRLRNADMIDRFKVAQNVNRLATSPVEFRKDPFHYGMAYGISLMMAIFADLPWEKPSVPKDSWS